MSLSIERPQSWLEINDEDCAEYWDELNEMKEREERNGE
jgi:hypothetical protein